MIALLGDDTSSSAEGLSRGRIPGIGLSVCVRVFVFFVCSVFMFLKVSEEKG